MTIERAENIIFSENEKKAIDLVYRILENTAKSAHSAELEIAARTVIISLDRFRRFEKAETNTNE